MNALYVVIIKQITGETAVKFAHHTEYGEQEFVGVPLPLAPTDYYTPFQTFMMHPDDARALRDFLSKMLGE